MSSNQRRRPTVTPAPVATPVQEDVVEGVSQENGSEQEGIEHEIGTASSEGEAGSVNNEAATNSYAMTSAQSLAEDVQAFTKRLSQSLGTLGDLHQIIGIDTLSKLGMSLASASALQALLERDLLEAESIHGFDMNSI
jgi:hypothetical protein